MEQETAGLVRRMAEGDSQAFDRLMEFYYPKILRMAYLISGSHADSEDIVQETFVKCYTYRKHLKEEVFGKEEPETASVLEEVMMRSQEKELYKAIRNLPVKQRTAVVLYYFNQMSTREIAGIMGCLEGTVKSRLYTARANLKQELMEECKRVGREVTL